MSVGCGEPAQLKALFHANIDEERNVSATATNYNKQNEELQDEIYYNRGIYQIQLKSQG